LRGRRYELRTQAGLTQQKLADRIAEALDKRVEIRFLPAKRLRTA
jgi:hypothetical protein